MRVGHALPRRVQPELELFVQVGFVSGRAHKGSFGIAYSQRKAAISRSNF